MNTPLRGGKASMYEGGVRVCSFVHWPGRISADNRIKEPIQIVDRYPTLIKLAGINASQPLVPDGLDIWPTLTLGAKSPHLEILLNGIAMGQAALRMGDWKLLRLPNGTDVKVDLYNLATDISEKSDLSLTQPAKVKAMLAKLDSLLAGAASDLKYLPTANTGDAGRFESFPSFRTHWLLDPETGSINSPNSRIFDLMGRLQNSTAPLPKF